MKVEDSNKINATTVGQLEKHGFQTGVG